MTTWNTSDAAAGFTFADGDLEAIASTVSGWGSVRSTTSKSSGKYYVEFAINHVDGSNGWMAGIANAAASLTTFIGATNNGAGLQAGGTYWTDGSPSSGVSGFTGATVLGLAVDFGAQKIWGTTNGSVWNGNAGGTQNPVTGAGGLSFSNVSGPWFLGFSGYNSGSDATTLATSTFVFSAPSGFSPWDVLSTIRQPIITIMC